MVRTHHCGELTEKNIGLKVTLSGWVHTRRDHGGVTFIDLRDREGLTQIVFQSEKESELQKQAREVLRNEYCISVYGVVRQRPAGTENSKISTGQIEVLAERVDILNSCKSLPFEIVESEGVSEEIRLRYRYLDLRNPLVYKRLRFRHRLVQLVRRQLDSEGFLEVETPILTKSTPEGARDYLVPSRLNVGHFYALPQSPQLFKQLLMVGGFEKYFQIAKCFRDEDLRADRQPEFTQLDLEMSFVEPQDIYGVIERLFQKIFSELLNRPLKLPFKRLSYQEAMERYGSDKPDLRFGMEIQDVSEYFSKTQFRIFKEAGNQGKTLRALTVSSGAHFSRSECDALIEEAKALGASGLCYLKRLETGWESPIEKFLSEEEKNSLQKKLAPKTGDLVLLVAERQDLTLSVLGAMRIKMARRLNLIPDNATHLSWVESFPLFKFNTDEKRWVSEHHPFTAPFKEDIPLIDKDPSKVRSLAYDLVMNGMEIASGSIRIHSRALQEKIFSILGLKKEEAKERFGFLLEALEFGAPPHGGIALGLDRLAAILTGAESIREVIAFPKTQKANCPLSQAPSVVSDNQLKELGIKIR